MEARAGYKKTELGWIPDDWYVVQIGSFTKPISQKNTSCRVSQVVSVTKYNGIVNSLSYFNKQVYSKDLSTYKIIRRNQFAYATIHLDEGSIGLLTSYDKAVLSPMYTVFETDEGQVNVNFLLCLLKSKRLMDLYQHIGSGSINRRKSISYSTFSKIDVSLPPLPEQQKIAEILTTVDDKISSIEDRIKQTEQLKKGLMEKLLTEGIGHTEFKDTEIGRIPASWQLLTLGKVCSFTQGIQIPYNEQINTHKQGYIRYLYIRDFFTDNHCCYVKDSCPNKIMKKSDIMMVNTGNTAGAVYSGAYGVLSNNAFKFGFDNNTLIRDFLFHFLKSHFLSNHLKKLSNTAGQPHVGHKNISNVSFQLPPLSEQNQIASILSTVDDKLDILQSKKANYETLKKGLMEQLLTGKIRVKV